MQVVAVFLLGLAITVALGFTVVLYLGSSLKQMLVDLCGTEQRAQFWLVFSNVILILVPAVFAMQFHFSGGEDLPSVFQLTYQLKWSVVGLVTSMLALGLILSMFIRRHSVDDAGK